MNLKKLNGNGKDHDEDTSTSPKSSEASHSSSGPQEPQSPYVEEFKLGDEQFNYCFPPPAAEKHSMTGYD
ncbi:unnamed protein product [Arabidopsis thaliana]|uniref:(thale cress) hypothetical protein n=1 Tax=Arabidopsis thaliana TaxID=3702 RepID=A0A7G2E3F6_ARATH|nr:unnamed protein product [Arabidopsis thaliana]